MGRRSSTWAWVASAHGAPVCPFRAVTSWRSAAPPAGYLNLVGTKDNAVDMIWWSGFPTATKDAILVYPTGIESSWDIGPAKDIHADNWWAVDHRIDDTAYLTDVVHDVLTCTKLAKPLDLVVVARSGDPDLSFAATPTAVTKGIRQVTVPTNLACWEKLDGCTGSPAVTHVGVLTESTWSCAAGTKLTYDLYDLPAHTWPGPDIVDHTPGATQLILDDLKVGSDPAATTSSALASATRATASSASEGTTPEAVATTRGTPEGTNATLDAIVAALAALAPAAVMITRRGARSS